MYLHLTDFKPDCYFGEGQLQSALKVLYSWVSSSPLLQGEKRRTHSDALLGRTVKSIIGARFGHSLTLAGLAKMLAGPCPCPIDTGFRVTAKPEHLVTKGWRLAGLQSNENM